MTVRRARIGNILELRREPIEIDAGATYRRIGIYSWGKGFLHRPPASGHEMGSMRYFTMPPGALVLSNIQAWEAAVGVSGEAELGHVASNRFLPYVPIDENRVTVRFLFHYLLSEVGLGKLRQASPGTQVRNRTLGKGLFEALEVPLPEIDEQRRIAAHLDAIAHQSAGVLRQGLHTASVHGVANQAVDDWIVMSGPSTSLQEVALINPSPRAVPPDDEIVFVPMASVDQSIGAITAPEFRRRSELTSGYKQFLVGDIIFARITPCMQNGKAAIYADALSRVAYGSTEFHVLRPHNPELARWIHAVLRTAWFRDQAARAFTGTAGQQRVPAGFLRDIRIPVPRSRTRDQAFRQLHDLERLDLKVRVVSEHRRAIADALLPAARNEIFSSMR